MVLAQAISSSAVKVSLLMICLSSKMLAKMISISPLAVSYTHLTLPTIYSV